MLADIVLEPKFADEDIVREKSVVLEEIGMAQDNPEDLVHELFTQNFWSTHFRWENRSWSTPETVSSFTREALQDWFRQYYAPNQIVITAAGHLTHEQLVKLVAERFSNLAPVPDRFNRSPETDDRAAHHPSLEGRT